MNEHGPLGGGATGPAEDAYYLMMRGDCAGALRIAEGKGEDKLFDPLRTLYLGAGSACLAAFDGSARSWPRAEAAVEKLTGQAAGLSCEDRAVFDLLQRLVEAHRAEPSARLVKRSGDKRPPVCPSFTKITPNHGPAEGGYTVQIEGRNLPKIVGVNFMEDLGVNHHLEAESRDGRHLVITVPRATHPETPAYVQPDGARTWSDSGVEFTYDPPAARRGPSTTTTRPSTTTTTTTTPRDTGSTSSTGLASSTAASPSSS